MQSSEASRFERFSALRRQSNPGVASLDDGSVHQEFSEYTGQDVVDILAPRDSGLALSADGEKLPDSPGPDTAAAQRASQQGRLFERLLSKSAKLSKIRQRLSINTTDLDYSRQMLQDMFRFLEESEDLYFEKFDRFGPGSVDHNSASALDWKHGVRTDFEAIRAQHKEVVHFERECSALQYRVSRYEQRFIRDAQALMAALEPIVSRQYDITRPGTVSQPGSSGSSSLRSDSPELPEVLLEYYTRCGDAGVYRERLANLDADHLEERVHRDLLVDQERPPQTPDSAFEQSYHNARAEIEEQIEQALKDSEDFRQQCVKQGIDLDSGRKDKRRSTLSSMYAGTGHLSLNSIASPAPAKAELAWLEGLMGAASPSTTPLVDLYETESHPSVTPERHKALQDTISRWNLEISPPKSPRQLVRSASDSELTSKRPRN